MPHAQWVTFLYGCAGSLATAIVNVLSLLDQERQVPNRYFNWSYCILRLSLAIVAGCLALASGIENKPLLAFGIGASAPIVVRKLAKGH